MLSIWVEELRISERVATKIICGHGISPAQVRAAVVQVSGLNFSWNFDSERGVRAIVHADLDPDLAPTSDDLAACEDPSPTLSDGRDYYEALIVLYPTDNPADQAWRLGSAYYILG